MTTDREELFDLLEALCDGAITPPQHERLQAAAWRRTRPRGSSTSTISTCICIFANGSRLARGEHSSGIDAPDAIARRPDRHPTSPPLHAPVSAIYSPMGSFAFSYLVAALIVGLGLMIGWVYQVSIPRVRSLGESANVSPPAFAQRPSAASLKWSLSAA